MENIQTQLNFFESTLDTTLAQLWSSDQLPQQLEDYVQGAATIAKAVEDLGDFCFKKLEADKNPSKLTGELLNCYIGNYVWPNHAKFFLILWRDIFFQQQKAYLLEKDGKVSSEALSQLYLRSKETLIKASSQLKNYWWEEVEKIHRDKQGVFGQLRQWKVQHNPWPTFKTQLTEIPIQCQQLEARYHLLHKTSDELLGIKRYMKELTETFTQQIAQMRKGAQEAIGVIEQEEEEKPARIATYTEGLNEQLKFSGLLFESSQRINKQLELLSPEVAVPVATQQGLVLTKEINFQARVKNWMELEIWPLFYEAGELSESVANAYKMALANISNRALLQSKESTEESKNGWNKESLCQPLKIFLQKTKTTEQELVQICESIESRFSKYFFLSSIYNSQEEFLPIPFPSTLHQIKTNQNALWLKIETWFKNQWQTIQRIRQSVTREDTLSVSEKTVRFIQHHTIDEHNQQYCSIFLTKGYIGESFWVGRKNELKRIKKIINQWHLGYRGAIILSGQRLSGKSLMGDLIANRYFANNVIRLNPQSTIDWQGRTFQTTYDLKEALAFIQKHTVTSRMLVWIDDLELWRDLNIPLQQNVRALTEQIDNHSRRIFFLVSMSNSLRDRLDKTMHISRVFQTEINLDRMEEADLSQAILIRHGATHKVLVDKDGAEVSPPQFKKMITQVYRSSEGNIGEALYDWAFSIQKADTEQVYFHHHSNTLPEFLHPDLAILLSTLMLDKKTTERRLLKLFGPAFKDRYQSMLQRLISVGLLTRHVDGSLEINEIAANQIGRQLERKKYLKFHH